MRGPGSLLSMSYWMGMCTAMALMLTIQDFIGKDAYIGALQEYWIAADSSMWVLWLIIAVLSTSAHVWLKSKINQKAVEIKEEEEDE